MSIGSDMGLLQYWHLFKQGERTENQGPVLAYAPNHGPLVWTLQMEFLVCIPTMYHIRNQGTSSRKEEEGGGQIRGTGGLPRRNSKRYPLLFHPIPVE